MDDEEVVVNDESGSESDPETGETVQTVETVIYTDQLQAIQEYQQLQVGLICVLIGTVLAFTVFNVLKRYL